MRSSDNYADSDVQEVNTYKQKTRSPDMKYILSIHKAVDIAAITYYSSISGNRVTYILYHHDSPTWIGVPKLWGGGGC
jgi:hypothetical protein